LQQGAQNNETVRSAGSIGKIALVLWVCTVIIALAIWWSSNRSSSQPAYIPGSSNQQYSGAQLQSNPYYDPLQQLKEKQLYDGIQYDQQQAHDRCVQGNALTLSRGGYATTKCP